MIAVKLDEDLPWALVNVIAARGIDVRNVHQQGWTGWDDQRVLSGIQGEGRWLFTADKGFGDIPTYPPGSHGGIVLFRADRESGPAYSQLATQLLDNPDLNQVPRALIVVSPRGIRIVRPP